MVHQFISFRYGTVSYIAVYIVQCPCKPTDLCSSRLAYT